MFEEWKSSPSLLWIHGKRTSISPFISHPTPYFFSGSGLGQECPLVCCFSLLLPVSSQIIAAPG
jgi:hypothetical protein